MITSISDIPAEIISTSTEMNISKRTVLQFYRSILKNAIVSKSSGNILYKGLGFDSMTDDIIPLLAQSSFNSTIFLENDQNPVQNPNLNFVETDGIQNLKNLSFMLVTSSDCLYSIVTILPEHTSDDYDELPSTYFSNTPSTIEAIWKFITESANLKTEPSININLTGDQLKLHEKVAYHVISQLDQSRMDNDRKLFELSETLSLLSTISGTFVEDEFLEEVGNKLIYLTEAPVGFIQSDPDDSGELKTVMIWKGTETIKGDALEKADYPINRYEKSLTDRTPISFNLTDDHSPFVNPDALYKLGVNGGIIYPLFGRTRLRGALILLFPDAKQPGEKHKQFFGDVALAVATGFRQLITHQQIHKQAVTDGLTSIYNHRFFMNQLTHEVHRAERYKNPLVLIMIDIDNFKNFNDTNGHPAGDEVLRVAAKIFEDSIRRTDFAARYGGEEFVVLLLETNIENGIRVAEKIRKAIDETHFEHQEKQPSGNLTISLGVAEYKTGTKDATEFIIQADSALYKAKESGRNKVCVASQD